MGHTREAHACETCVCEARVRETCTHKTRARKFVRAALAQGHTQGTSTASCCAGCA